MGAYLSTPKTEKETSLHNNEDFECVASSMQGWRVSQEDAHVVDLDGSEAAFGVFDGHGGSEVSKYVAQHAMEVLKATSGYQQKVYPLALKEMFLGLDAQMLTPEGQQKIQEILRSTNDSEALGTDSMAGCTANFALIKDGFLYCANSGDSRCVLCRGGQAVAMSEDHKPEQERERSRIYAAGGTVTGEGRVNGNLNLSRSLGDFEYKKNTSLPAEEQIITANPDIKSEKLQYNDQFMILACDGVWDILSNQEAVDFVKNQLGTKSLQEICEDVFTRCLATDVGSSGGLGCDNMTCIIVVFKKKY